MVFGGIGMGSGKLRHSWSWMWQGSWGKKKKELPEVYWLEKENLNKCTPPPPSTSVIIHTERADRISWHLTSFLAQFFCSHASHISHIPGLQDEEEIRVLGFIGENPGQDYRRNLNIDRSLALDESKGSEGKASVGPRALSTAFEKRCRPVKSPVTGEKGKSEYSEGVLVRNTQFCLMWSLFSLGLQTSTRSAKPPTAWVCSKREEKDTLFFQYFF